MFKVLIVVLFLGILASLASGLVFLVRDKGQSDRTVKALTVRIAISFGLFLLLMGLYAAGVVQPHGL